MSTITITIDADGPITQGVAQSFAQQAAVYADAAYDDLFTVTSVRATQDSISRVWKHDGEPNRIHYVRDERRLYEDRGSAFFDLLEAEWTERRKTVGGRSAHDFDKVTSGGQS